MLGGMTSDIFAHGIAGRSSAVWSINDSRINIIRVWMENMGIIIDVREGRGSEARAWEGAHGKGAAWA